MVKHARPLGGTSMAADALDAVERGRADCLIVTGLRTGAATSAEDLKSVRESLKEAGRKLPVLVGSGVTPDNAEDLLRLSDGIIVGSYIREKGTAGRPLDPERLAEMSRTVRKLRD
jgi:hypothetical protein